MGGRETTRWLRLQWRKQMITTPKVALARESVLQYVSRAVEQGPDPEQVARAILRVATTPRPRLRYRVGPRANLLVGLRQLLPASLFERVYRRVFHLNATVVPMRSS